MEHLAALLNELKKVTLDDISNLPKDNQHVVAEHLEQLQDDLKSVLGSSSQPETPIACHH